MKLICTLRAMFGMKPVHKWKRPRATAPSPGLAKECRRCGLVRQVKQRVKAA